MTPLIIWLSVFLLILTILVTPIRFYFRYDDGAITKSVSIYNVKIKIRKKKTEKEKKEETPEKPAPKSPVKILKKAHENYPDIKLLVHKISKKVLKSITVENFTVNMIESTGDSAKTAISFGYKSWIVNWFSAIISDIFTVKHVEINLRPDFTEKEKKNIFSILVRIRVFGILNILLVILFNFKKVMNLVKKFKED